MAFLTPDKVYIINGVSVKQFFLTEHNPNKIEMPDKRIKPLIGITIHNTESIKVPCGTTQAEQYVRATYNGNMGISREHYFVDEKEAWQDLPDDWTGWHARDGADGKGNTQTIAIEIIGNSAKAEENGAKLAAGLLKKYGLTIESLYTHSHWMNVYDGKTGSRDYLNTLRRTDKNCPVYILPHWADFEKKVKHYLDADFPSNSTNSSTLNPSKFSKGDIVDFKGGYHYSSSVAVNPAGSKKTAGKAKITSIASGTKHPYHLVGIDGGSNVYGWVNVEDIESVSDKISVGDKVKIKTGAKTYDGKNLASFVYNNVYKVKEIGTGKSSDRVVIWDGIYVIAAVKMENLIKN